jgi:hypothetical protein
MVRASTSLSVTAQMAATSGRSPSHPYLVEAHITATWSKPISPYLVEAYLTPNSPKPEIVAAVVTAGLVAQSGVTLSLSKGDGRTMLVPCWSP